MSQFARWLGSRPAGGSVPADIAALITALGVTPLGIFDARYGLTTSSWIDARGAGFPVVTYSGGTPTISGSGATKQGAFTAATTASGTYSGAVPSTGVSIFYIGSFASGNNFASGIEWFSPSFVDIAIGSFSANWAMVQFTSSTKSLNSTHTAGGGSVLNAVAGYVSWAGAAAIQPNAEAQVTSSSFTALTPTGAGSFEITSAQGIQQIQAVIYLPNLYTVGQYNSLISWATAQHTFTVI